MEEGHLIVVEEDGLAIVHEQEREHAKEAANRNPGRVRCPLHQPAPMMGVGVCFSFA